MRMFPLVVSVLLAAPVFGQQTRIDYVKVGDTGQRTELTASLSGQLRSAFGFLPTLKPEHIYVKNDFAFFTGTVFDPNGREINFASLKAEPGPLGKTYSGRQTKALLKRTGEKWQVLAFLISPDDESWACWWADFSAPKELFDYTETCR